MNDKQEAIKLIEDMKLYTSVWFKETSDGRIKEAFEILVDRAKALSLLREQPKPEGELVEELRDVIRGYRVGLVSLDELDDIAKKAADCIEQLEAEPDHAALDAAAFENGLLITRIAELEQEKAEHAEEISMLRGFIAEWKDVLLTNMTEEMFNEALKEK